MVQPRDASKAIILFDGVCNLCNATVQMIIKKDKADYFRFASLQSDIGKQLLSQYHLPVLAEPESIVLIEQGKVYQYATAALRIAGRLSGWRRLLYPLVYFPSFLRNGIYKF